MYNVYIRFTILYNFLKEDNTMAAIKNIHDVYLEKACILRAKWNFTVQEKTRSTLHSRINNRFSPDWI